MMFSSKKSMPCLQCMLRAPLRTFEPLRNCPRQAKCRVKRRRLAAAIYGATTAKCDYLMQVVGMSCPSWQWHRTGSRWSPVRTLLVAPLWCDLGFFPNSRGNKAAANLCPRERRRGKVRGERGKQADRERLRKRELVSKRASKPERQMED